MPRLAGNLGLLLVVTCLLATQTTRPAVQLAPFAVLPEAGVDVLTRRLRFLTPPAHKAASAQLQPRGNSPLAFSFWSCHQLWLVVLLCAAKQ